MMGEFTPHSQAMSEEQLKVSEAEDTGQEEDAVEEISEDDLKGVAGGISAGVMIQEPENVVNF